MNMGQQLNRVKNLDEPQAGDTRVGRMQCNKDGREELMRKRRERRKKNEKKGWPVDKIKEDKLTTSADRRGGERVGGRCRREGRGGARAGETQQE